jgi:hypothetical protein
VINVVTVINQSNAFAFVDVNKHFVYKRPVLTYSLWNSRGMNTFNSYSENPSPPARNRLQDRDIIFILRVFITERSRYIMMYINRVMNWSCKEKPLALRAGAQNNF